MISEYANIRLDRYFVTDISVKITNHAHIRDEQVKIYMNLCFVSKFTSKF